MYVVNKIKTTSSLDTNRVLHEPYIQFVCVISQVKLLLINYYHY